MKKLLFTFLLSLSFVLFIGIGRVYAAVNPVTPSTNDINRANGWAHVDKISTNIGSTELQFISTRTFWSCFEYRSDNETNTVIGANPNPAITDGRWTQVCVNNSSISKTISASQYVDVRMVYGAETDERFDWTRFDVLFERKAEIISPADGEVVWGEVEFEATLYDRENNDNVQWAIRRGTCDAGVGTVAGNVDGFHNDFNWNHEIFFTTINTSTWTSGDYCFVFNPTESSGDTPIRITRNFKLNNDLDGDNVWNSEDLCPSTISDELSDGYILGVNRHMWISGKNFLTLIPAKRSSFKPANSQFTIEDTFGCSCDQILDIIADKAGIDLTGHYKFGCSKSIIEDWIRGTYHVGLIPFETINIPATSNAITSGTIATEIGTQYELTASGTYKFVDWTDAGMADASCSLRIPGSFNDTGSINWILGSALPSPYTNYLELQVNGSPAQWGACNIDNTYTKMFDGTGLPFTFQILDNAYGDNVGSLNVNIMEDKWVELR